jgi:hypothetical protein
MEAWAEAVVALAAKTLADGKRSMIAGSWRARHGIAISCSLVCGISRLRSSGLNSVRKGPDMRIEALSTAIIEICGCRREGRSDGKIGWSGL